MNFLLDESAAVLHISVMQIYIHNMHFHEKTLKSTWLCCSNNIKFQQLFIQLYSFLSCSYVKHLTTVFSRTSLTDISQLLDYYSHFRWVFDGSIKWHLVMKIRSLNTHVTAVRRTGVLRTTFQQTFCQQSALKTFALTRFPNCIQLRVAFAVNCTSSQRISTSETILLA